MDSAELEQPERAVRHEAFTLLRDSDRMQARRLVTPPINCSDRERAIAANYRVRGPSALAAGVRGQAGRC